MLHVPENLSTTSGLPILMHCNISLLAATLYDKLILIGYYLMCYI